MSCKTSSVKISVRSTQCVSISVTANLIIFSNLRLLDASLLKTYLSDLEDRVSFRVPPTEDCLGVSGNPKTGRAQGCRPQGPREGSGEHPSSSPSKNWNLDSLLGRHELFVVDGCGDLHHRL